MTKRDALLVVRLRRHGIVNPILTLRAARKAGLPLDIACAFLEQETGGGHNVFGHDPAIFRGAGKVTKAKYLAYKKLRGDHGQGGMQGVGPMQLTWWKFQDLADELGGCWKPRHNIAYGFTHAAELIRRHGLMPGIALYNGTGPAAHRYAESVRAKARHWRLVIDAPVFRPQTIAGTHFTWREARSKPWPGEPDGVRVPLRLRANVIRHARNLEKLRARINAERRRRGLRPTGLGVTSWYRTPGKNHFVGGAAGSWHMVAVATDHALEEIRRLCPWKGGREFFDTAASIVFARGGFGQYPAGARHVDSRGFRARWSSFKPGK